MCVLMKKRLGFALVEMLVVIGAISALSAIAYPSVDKGFEKGRESRDITAMHSADSLMTSAALTGRIIDGKPAKDYTGSTPLYFDGDGNLTSTPPAPYGKGTLKGAGEIWSCCDDYQYNPNGDYTNGYIYCWYDPATRVTHVHWSSDSTPGDSGSTPTTPPKYDNFPTRATTEPTKPPTDPSDETMEPTPPITPTQEPVLDLSTAHPSPKWIRHYYGPDKDWQFKYEKTGHQVITGHRYSFDGHIYVALNTPQLNTDYDPLLGQSFDGNFSSWFVEATGKVWTTDNYNEHNNLVGVNHGDIFKDTTADGTVYYYIFNGSSTDATIFTHPSGDTKNWIQIQDCPDHCGEVHDYSKDNPPEGFTDYDPNSAGA